MKRTLLAAIALSMLAVPAAHADYRPSQRHDVQQGRSIQGHGIEKHRRIERGHVQTKKEIYKKKVVREHVVKKPRWVKGHRMPAWQRQHVVRDYHRHGLRKPRHDQQWVRVGNDYVLIGIASGIIASMIAGH